MPNDKNGAELKEEDFVLIKCKIVDMASLVSNGRYNLIVSYDSQQWVVSSNDVVKA